MALNAYGKVALKMTQGMRKCFIAFRCFSISAIRQTPTSFSPSSSSLCVLSLSVFSVIHQETSREDGATSCEVD